MKRIVEAVFVGQNGSLGYVHGKSYVLELEYFRGVTSMTMWSLSPSGRPCEYSSFLTFLDNWTNIKKVK